MLHKLSVDGFAYRLRPARDDDAEFIVELRNDPLLRRYLHAGATSVPQQLEWFANYHARPGDYYFVIERIASGRAEGTVAIYDIDGRVQSGEWGRWIVRPGSLAAVESAWLVYKAAFEHIGLGSVYCRTVARNVQVVAFHDSCDLANRTLLPSHFTIDGHLVDAVEHRLPAGGWPDLSQRLTFIAEATARRLNRGQ